MNTIIDTIENGSMKAVITKTPAGAYSIKCSLAGHEVITRIFPACYAKEAELAARHFVKCGVCPACPGSATDADFWKNQH